MQDDEKLKKLLKNAFGEEELPDGFFKSVKTRIESKKTPVDILIEQVLSGIMAICRPKAALLLIAIAMFFGFTAGAVGGLFARDKIIQIRYINTVLASELR